MAVETMTQRYFVLGDAAGNVLGTSGKLMTAQEAEALPSEVWRFFTATAVRAELTEQIHGMGRKLKILYGKW